MAKIATSASERTRAASTVKTAKPSARKQTPSPEVALEAGATSAPRHDGPAQISPDERRGMIATAAYYRAQRRGFVGGSAEQDWLLAEAEVDLALGRTRV